MNISRNTSIILLVIANIAVDQISKFWVRATVEAKSSSSIIGDYLTLRNVENDGAFLGMGGDLNPTLKLFVLLIIPSAVLLFVLYYMFKEKHMDKLSLTGFSCVVGGGIANVFDRFIYGSVTDFLFIDLGFVRTGIFNLADLSVTTGMILILWSSLKHRKKDNVSS
ncbi:signal peptidase II [Pontimicrobium aquaticum]|uniref:Lipoprotein signal peptidase n=1 Tax=Pontimicrobium aquaticum TaxID=2565367 RepID=A0A4U0EYD0_9FLAO|nr:signal peptidase II [Pontimicrobium aquaticum]TJY36930.1 signal peptidase II [Pontimicrobium aquaticum]